MSKESMNYHTHISAKHNWFDLKLKEVWEYRDLIILFTKRSFTVSYKQTILGPAWLFIHPFMSSIVYTIVFGHIAGIGTNGVPRLLFYMTGTAMWNFFSSCLSNNAGTFVGNAGLFGKVYFPRLTVPISNILIAAIKFCIQMFLVLMILLYYVYRGTVHPNWWMYLLLPVILIHLGFLGMGIGIILSSMTTKYRDLSVLVGFGVQLFMYATPVVYPLSQISGGVLRKIICLNPVTMPMEFFRYIVLGTGQIDWIYFLVSIVITILLLLIGIAVFNRVERTFMDTV